jgi:hypothetical protein
MRLDPPQVWLRQYWCHVGGFTAADVHPRFFVRKDAVEGVSYALCSHVARYDSIGATTKPVDRVYSHHHNCMSRNGKQLPIYDDMRRVGIHQYWFVVLYSIRAPLKDVMLVESALQQLLLPTSNVAVRSKSLPVDRILKGFRPIMRFRNAPRNDWKSSKQAQKFTNVSLGISSHLLSDLLSSVLHSGMRCAIFQVSPGQFSLQDSIKHVWSYRFSVVQFSVEHWESKPMPLVVAMRKKKWAAATQLIVLSLLAAPHDAIMHRFCWLCVRKPIVLYDLKRITPDCMLGLYMSAYLYLSAKPAQFLRNRIDASCRHIYGFMLSTRPTLKIPRDKSVSKVVAAQFLRWLIQQLPLHTAVIAWFCSRAQIVFTSPKSLGEVILNHRQTARSMKISCAPACTCSVFPFPRNAEGCVETRASHPSVLLFCGPLIGMNLTTKLLSDGQVALSTLQKSMDILQDSFVRQVVTHDTWGKAVLVPWLKQQCDLAVKTIWKPIEVVDSLFTHTEAVRINSQLNGLVVLPLDRNINAAYLMCPTVFWSRFKATYWDSPCYTHLHTEEKFFVSKMRSSYMQHGFHKVVPMTAGGTLGSSYILPKNKNPAKSRPIVNTKGMPGRKMSSVVSAVLMLLISKAVTFMHFNLSATKDLKHRLHEFSRYFTKFDDVSLFSFDVNNMYSVLPHNSIMNALYQFLQLVRARLRTLSFHIYKFRKRKAAMTGRSPGSSKFYTIKFHQLPSFVQWEMEFMVFVAGSQILQQTTCIAMGGCCSPAMAQILCMYCEIQWLQSLKADAKYVRGVRFMDDSLLAVVRGAENLIQSYLTDCYPTECTLDGKLEAASVVPLLETAVHTFARKNLVCVHVNKNTAAIIDSKCQTILRYTHRYSAAGLKQRHAAWNGVFARMVSNTSPGFYFNLWWPCWAFFLELRYLGYSWSAISRFLRSLHSWRFDCPPQWNFQLQLFFRCLSVLVTSLQRLLG